MKKRILILEDEPSARFLLKYYFSRKYDLVIFENGLEGLNWLEKGNRVDLIISDLEMPKMDGFEFVRRLSKDDRFRDIKILVNSSLEEFDARTKLGADCPYIQKSDQFSQLKGLVSNIIDNDAP
ncbi:response regulator [Roseivirga echinicomitans]